MLNLKKTAYENCVVTYYIAIDGEFQLGSYMEKVFLHLKIRTWLQMMEVMIVLVIQVLSLCLVFQRGGQLMEHSIRKNKTVLTR